MSSSDMRPLNPFISNLGPAPSRRTTKISPSVEPRVHSASVRLDGFDPFGADGPSPIPSAPWQKRQYFWYAAFPAETEAAVAATGFFILRPSALPCAFRAIPKKPPTTSPKIAAVDTRRIIPSPSTAVD